ATFVVQQRAHVVVSAMDIGPQPICLGSTRQIALPVTNDGEASAEVDGAVLSIAPDGDRLAVSRSDPVRTVSGGDTAILSFDVFVPADEALRSARETATFTVNAADGNSGETAIDAEPRDATLALGCPTAIVGVVEA